MTLLGQQLLNGVALGSGYSLFALGLSLVFGVNRILNFAHGAVFMCGAMIGYWGATHLSLPLPLALLSGMAGAGLVNVMLDLVCFRRLSRRHAPEAAAVVSSIGAILILEDVAQRLTRTEAMRFPLNSLPSHPIALGGGVALSVGQGVTIASTVLLTGVLQVFLRHTMWGTRIRALGASETTSSLLGMNVSLVRSEVFFVSGALAGAAGVLIGVTLNDVEYSMGQPYLLNGLAVLIIGGMGSIGGALVAGLLLGVLTTLTIQYVSSDFSQMLPFALIVLLLLLRPTGLFGSPGDEAMVARR